MSARSVDPAPRRGGASPFIVGVLAIALGACGGAAATTNVPLRDAARYKQSPQVAEARALAPQVYAQGEADLAEAERAQAAGDGTAAELYAERASATFGRAVSLARAARATTDADASREKLARSEEERGRLARDLSEIERETDDLEKRLRVAREALLPPPSGKASAERDEARLKAARAMLTEARLVCASASLLEDGDEVKQALRDLEAAEQRADDPAAKKDSGQTIDAAARLRARCVGLVTRARRQSKVDATADDTWLADLSSAGFAPSRDERGVAVTLRPAWGAGDATPRDAEGKLTELGRFAASNKAAVLVVVHDAAPGGAREREQGDRRGAAVKAALVKAGVAEPRVRVALAGARAPLVDPADAARRARNARIEIVFVR